MNLVTRKRLTCGHWLDDDIVSHPVQKYARQHSMSMFVLELCCITDMEETIDLVCKHCPPLKPYQPGCHQPISKGFVSGWL